MTRASTGRALRVVMALAGAASLAAAGCGGTDPRSSATAAVDPGATGRVTGRVVLDGAPPRAQTVRVDGDKTCATLVPGATLPAGTWVVGDGGGLANAFVYVKTGLEGRSFPVPAEPVTVDQQRCWYLPRVVGVRVGQPLVVLNSDPLLHNVRATGVVNQTFVQGQPVQGMRYTHTFATDEVMVPLTCDVHAWMRAWVGVVSHPYFAVTGPSGDFTLPGLPAGTYLVEAWHEAGGATSGTVTVTAQGTATLSLSFKAPTA